MTITRRKKILFLGYSGSQTSLVDALVDADCKVDHTSDRIEKIDDKDLVISFGYRHILRKRTIDEASCPILNLHIAYLPYNRGAHPNFWSFYDNTPSGVTIHLMNEGIDTGPILYQRHVNFDSDQMTFARTYRHLVTELETLFIDNMETILSGNRIARPQRGKGTYHSATDLPDEFSGWDAEIQPEIDRLKSIIGRRDD